MIADASNVNPALEEAQAQIHERGYRRYDGIRTGVPGAMRALVLNSVQRALGLRRSARHKIMPAAVVLMAYLPGAAFVGAAALIPEELEAQFLPTYAEYYGFISAALFLFAAFFQIGFNDLTHFMYLLRG